MNTVCANAEEFVCMKKFMRYQKRIIKSSPATSIIYFTGLLYCLYIICTFFFKQSAAVQFAEEELIVVIAGIVIGYIANKAMKKRRRLGAKTI